MGCVGGGERGRGGSGGHRRSRSLETKLYFSGEEQRQEQTANWGERESRKMRGRAPLIGCFGVWALSATSGRRAGDVCERFRQSSAAAAAAAAAQHRVYIILPRREEKGMTERERERERRRTEKEKEKKGECKKEIKKERMKE